MRKPRTLLFFRVKNRVVNRSYIVLKMKGEIMDEMIRNIWDHEITVGDTVIFTLASTAVVGIATFVGAKLIDKKNEKWEEEKWEEELF